MFLGLNGTGPLSNSSDLVPKFRLKSVKCKKFDSFVVVRVGTGAGRYYSSGREDAQLSVSIVGSRGKTVVWMTLVKVSNVWKPTAAALNDENGPKLKVKAATRN